MRKEIGDIETLCYKRSDKENCYKLLELCKYGLCGEYRGSMEYIKIRI